MKKRYSAIALTLISSLLILTGCGKKVDLGSSIANTQKIKSYAYDLNVSVDVANSKIASPTSAMLQDGNASINFNGKIQDTGDRIKLSSDIKISSSEVSFEDPIYLDAAKEGFDFNLFVGVSGILQSMFGDSLSNISMLYLSSNDLGNFIKDTQGEEAYNEFQSSVNASDNNSNEQMSKDMLKVFNDFIKENQQKVLKFEEIEGLSKSSNGKYTITLSKENIKTIVSNYFSNEEYFENYKEFMDKSSKLSSVSGGVSTESDAIKNLDAQTTIDNFNKVIDEYKELNVVTTFTIKDKIITETNAKITANISDDVITISLDNKISEINKINDIEMPDKNAENTLNIIDLYKDFMSSGLISTETEITIPNSNQ